MTIKLLLAGAVAAGSYIVARRSGAGNAVFAFLAPMAMFMSWIGMTAVRAQLFTLVFLVVLLGCLEADRRGNRRWLLLWLPVWLLWLNMHGGFVVGGALFALHALEQLLRRRPVAHLAAAGILMAALIAINPFGLAYYEYLVGAIALDRSLIIEWLPLWQARSPISAGERFHPFLVVYCVSLVVALYAFWKRGLGGSPGAVLVLAAAAAALKHQRHLSIYAVVWAVHIPAAIEGTELGRMLSGFWRRRASAALWAALLVFGGVVVATRRPWELRLPANPGEHPLFTYPVGAVEHLKRAGFRGNLMTPFISGAFVSWRLHPQVKVSLDGRFEAAYPPGALEDNLRFYNHEAGWLEELSRHPTDAVLIPKDGRVAPAMRAEGGWDVIYEDDAYEIHARPGLAMPVADRRGERLRGDFP
jgi:hypothetical protein